MITDENRIVGLIALTIIVSIMLITGQLEQMGVIISLLSGLILGIIVPTETVVNLFKENVEKVV